jgi:hypothetical protein
MYCLLACAARVTFITNCRNVLHRVQDLFSLLLDISLARDSTDGRKHLLEEIDIQVFHTA